MFLRVRPQKSSIAFGKGEKLSPRLVGPFEISKRKGSVTHRLALPPSPTHMHDVLHVSVLCHYISDPSHIIDLGHLQVSNEGTMMVELVCILDQQTLQLRRRFMDQVKV